MTDGSRTRRAARYCKDAGKRHGKRARAGIVIFLTSDKIIQAILTGAVTGVVFSSNEAIASYVQLALRPIVPFYVPVKLYAAIGATVLVVAAYHIDRRTDEWRSWVRNTTGEETATDSAADEDVAGDPKQPR